MIIMADYTGINWGKRAGLDHDLTDLIIVGDPRFTIQQSMGVIARKKNLLQVKLAYYKKLVEQFALSVICM